MAVVGGTHDGFRFEVITTESKTYAERGLRTKYLRLTVNFRPQATLFITNWSNDSY